MDFVALPCMTRIWSKSSEIIFVIAVPVNVIEIDLITYSSFII